MPSSPKRATATKAANSGKNRRRSAPVKAEKRKTVRPDVALVDLITLAEEAVGSLQTVFEALDASILREFADIAGSIARAREDIGQLQPHELSKQHIPEAGAELNAIVEATEDATHRIMESAELMLASGDLPADDYRATVEAEVMKIFEACAFQDITGQRVNKVVHTLQDIEDRVVRMAGAIGAHHAKPERGSREAKRRERHRKLILNGPALEGGGVGQSDIDALFD